MLELAVNNPFGFFVQRKREIIQTKRKNNFEATIPSQTNIQEYKDSDYFLDSISSFARNQSLTPEQIAGKQAESINSEINDLRSKFEITNFEEVRNFLTKNRFLVSLVEEIPSKIYQYFGIGQKLALQVLYEPDFPQSFELWIHILTELSAKEALPVLERFDEEWWLENMDKSDGKLNITLKFV